MLRSLFRPRLAHIVALVLIIGVVLVVVHLTTVNSEAYRFADHFVATDGRVTKLTGPQSERTLLWRKGFEFSYGEKSGEAKLMLGVVSEQGTFHVPIRLLKKDGRWSVTDAVVVDERGDETAIVARSNTE